MRKYDEAMAHIRVTPAMRARVLRRVRQSAARRTAWRRAAALAACLAVAVLGALVLPSVHTSGARGCDEAREKEKSPSVQVAREMRPPSPRTVTGMPPISRISVCAYV